MGDPKSIGSDVPNLMKDVQNCQGYTKFYEECTKGSKVSSEGIGPQSLPYGFQNEIMHHPCSDTGPESNRIRCTKGSKVHSEVGISPQSLPYRFQNEIMDNACLDRGPRSNRIGCTK